MQALSHSLSQCWAQGFNGSHHMRERECFRTSSDSLLDPSELSDWLSLLSSSSESSTSSSTMKPPREPLLNPLAPPPPLRTTSRFPAASFLPATCSRHSNFRKSHSLLTSSVTHHAHDLNMHRSQEDREIRHIPRRNNIVTSSQSASRDMHTSSSNKISRIVAEQRWVITHLHSSGDFIIQTPCIHKGCSKAHQHMT